MRQESHCVTPGESSSGDTSALLGPELLLVVDFYWRRRYWLLAGMLATMAMALAYLCIVGPRYDVVASLYYRMGQEIMPPPTIQGKQILVTRRKEDVNNEIEILTSPDLMHEVVASLGEAFFTPPPPVTQWQKIKRTLSNAKRAVTDTVQLALEKLGLRPKLTQLEKIELALSEQLDVELVEDTDVMSITLTTPAPDHGEIILERLLEAYHIRHLATHEDSGVRQFFTEQTQQRREELRASEARLLEFQIENDVWSLDTTTDESMSLHEKLQQDIVSAEAQLASLETELKSIDLQLADQPESVLIRRRQQFNPVRAEYQERIATVALAGAAIASSYREGTPETLSWQEQREALQRGHQLEPELVPFDEEYGLNSARVALQATSHSKSAELDGLRKRVEVLHRRRQEVEQTLEKNVRVRSQAQQMQREVELLSKNYATYAGSYEEARITEVMNQASLANYRVVSPPTAILTPRGPSLKMVLVAAAVAGMAMASGLALVWDIQTAFRVRTRGKKAIEKA
ncbi:MAG: Wzz/FepE/Etk N-terminal domain-containing protein [Pirellulaceae bacterium]|nr:hypothetical protein [Planctomycetales bacterium]